VEWWKAFVTIGKGGLWLWQSKRRLTEPQTSGRRRIDSVMGRRDGFAAEWVVCGRHTMTIESRGQKRGRSAIIKENLRESAERGVTRRGAVLDTGCTTLSVNGR